MKIFITSTAEMPWESHQNQRPSYFKYLEVANAKKLQ